MSPDGVTGPGGQVPALSPSLQSLIPCVLTEGGNEAVLGGRMRPFPWQGFCCVALRGRAPLCRRKLQDVAQRCRSATSADWAVCSCGQPKGGRGTAQLVSCSLPKSAPRPGSRRCLLGADPCSAAGDASSTLQPVPSAGHGSSAFLPSSPTSAAPSPCRALHSSALQG